MFEPGRRVIKLSNGSKSGFAKHVLEPCLGVVDEVKITPLPQKIVGKDRTAMSSKAMIRKHDRNRSQGFDTLQQLPRYLIKLTVTLSDLLDSAVLVCAVVAGFFYIAPKLVLNPVRLLEVDHAHIPFVFLQQEVCQLESLLKATNQLAEEQFELLVGFRVQQIPKRKVKRRAIVGYFFEYVCAKTFGISEACLDRGHVPP